MHSESSVVAAGRTSPTAGLWKSYEELVSLPYGSAWASLSLIVILWLVQPVPHLCLLSLLESGS